MKYALIIGNNKYDDPKLAQLKTPSADSHALAKALADKNIGSFDEVTPLINKTETEIRRAISGFFSNKKPDDLVLVYFSGHGVLDDRGRLYLSLKDTQTNLLKATAIPSSFITDEMDSCRSKRQVLILDCCHSGAFARGTKGDQKAVTEATFEGSGFGRVVLTASDSTQYALEGNQVIKQTDLSLFTHFLLEGLSTGEADRDNDGFISLGEWYDYTYTRVISNTPNQVPHKWSYHQQGDLVIAKNPFVKKKIVELSKETNLTSEVPIINNQEIAIKEFESKSTIAQDLDRVSRPVRQKIYNVLIEFSKNLTDLILVLPFWLYFAGSLISSLTEVLLHYDFLYDYDIDLTNVRISAYVIYALLCFLLVLYGVNIKKITAQSLYDGTSFLVGFLAVEGITYLHQALYERNGFWIEELELLFYYHKNSWNIVFIVASSIMIIMLSISRNYWKSKKLTVFFIWLIWKAGLFAFLKIIQIQFTQDSAGNFLGLDITQDSRSTFYNLHTNLMIANCFIAAVATILFLPYKKKTTKV